MDLPDPLRPVMTMNWSRGIFKEIPLRLCSLAPRIVIVFVDIMGKIMKDVTKNDLIEKIFLKILIVYLLLFRQAFYQSGGDIFCHPDCANVFFHRAFAFKLGTIFGRTTIESESGHGGAGKFAESPEKTVIFYHFVGFGLLILPPATRLFGLKSQNRAMVCW